MRHAAVTVRQYSGSSSVAICYSARMDISTWASATEAVMATPCTIRTLPAGRRHTLRLTLESDEVCVRVRAVGRAGAGPPTPTICVPAEGVRRSARPPDRTDRVGTPCSSRYRTSPILIPISQPRHDDIARGIEAVRAASRLREGLVASARAGIHISNGAAGQYVRWSALPVERADLRDQDGCGCGQHDQE